MKNSTFSGARYDQEQQIKHIKYLLAGNRHYPANSIIANITALFISNRLFHRSSRRLFINHIFIKKLQPNIIYHSNNNTTKYQNTKTLPASKILKNNKLNKIHSHQPPATSHQPPATSHQPPATSKMKNTLERFRIFGLHGQKNIDASIENNTIIIVGENGSGKTTFLRILFNFLSGRWSQLINFRFESITATIEGVEYKISHDQLVKSFKVFDRRALSDIPPSVRRRVFELIETGDIEKISAELERSGTRYSSPSAIIRRQLEFFEDTPGGPNKELNISIKRIQDAIKAQVLYLPTYRRIERELNSIFEGIDSNDFRRRKNIIHQNESGDSYIELVEFGMKDVQQAVDRTLERLKEFARESLNNLTIEYLGDVVSRDYQNVGTKEISDLSEETVRSVLDRIQESILTKAHKERLFGLINSTRSAETQNEHEKIICHYFLKLLKFQRSLQENEQQISEFCNLCSEYIVNKKFVYDSQTFSFSIVPTNESQANRSITLSDLSSGEKQIVSLFSHLYLSGQKNFFVLIDEPELSLSVPWQRRFLKDIRSGKFCAGLVAVTHSPFIYDNDLRIYAHSIDEFMI